MELSIIQSKIYEIRGYKVILDFDLAEMYEVPTKVLNQSVKRNIERFPPDFMFQLTNKEFRNLRSQFETSNWSSMRYLPNAFTEHGVTMLTSVLKLKSKRAIEVNIQIVRAFVVFRQYALGYAELNRKLENFMIETNMQFNEIYQTPTRLANHKKSLNKSRNPIGFTIPQCTKNRGLE